MKRRTSRARRFDFKKLLDRKFLPIYIGVVAVMLALVLVLGAGKGKAVTSAGDTAFAAKGTIEVGIVTENSPLAFSEEDGGVSGFDSDVMTELLNRPIPIKR